MTKIQSSLSFPVGPYVFSSLKVVAKPFEALSFEFASVPERPFEERSESPRKSNRPPSANRKSSSVLKNFASLFSAKSGMLRAVGSRYFLKYPYALIGAVTTRPTPVAALIPSLAQYEGDPSPFVI